MNIPIYDCPKCGHRYKVQASRIIRHIRSCIGVRAHTVQGTPIKSVNTSMCGTKVLFTGRDGRDRVGRIRFKQYNGRGPYAVVHYWDSSGMARNLFLGRIRQKMPVSNPL